MWRRSAVPGPDTLAISRQITGLLLCVYAMRMAAVFTISTATITLRTKVIPGWIGMLGFAVAAVLLVSVGLTPWVELLGPWRVRLDPFPFGDSPARFELVRRVLPKNGRVEVLVTRAEPVAITIER